MTDLFLLSPAQIAKIEPFFLLSHGVPRVDDRRVISSIIYVLKHGLQWKDAPKDYGPHKTLYNRFRRWTELGGFDKIFSHLAASVGPPETMMIDATHLKAHRTASSLLKGGISPPYRPHKGGAEHQAARRVRWTGTAHRDVSDGRTGIRSHRCQDPVPSTARRSQCDDDS